MSAEATTAPGQGEELERAATKIQAAFRGKKAREETGGSAAITVGVRMRPFVPHEKKNGEPTACIALSENIVKVVSAAVGPNAKESNEGPWKFDLAMDSSDPSSPVFVDNNKCYQLMGRRMIDDILGGFNTCLFCYGQTGTGKTTTIMGDPQNGPGLLRRLLDDIFLEAGKLRESGAQVDIDIQMLEVYNEELNDLLLEKGKPAQKIQTRTLPGGVTVQGATTRPVQTADECQQQIDYGNGNKTVAATAMNPQSSRGHTVFKLIFKKSGGSDGTKLASEVYFADLAGHENIKTTAVTGDRLKELTFINSSLMWLQNALHSMAEASGKKGSQKVDFSKFRNSKLTLLLANALTGNSKTAVIVTLSPSLEHFDTSLSSIKFAVEVKGIKVKVSSSAGQDPNVVIARLEKENKELKAKLAAANGDPVGAGAGTEAPASEATELKGKFLAAESAIAELRTELTAATPNRSSAGNEVEGLAVGRASAGAPEPEGETLRGEIAALREELSAASGAPLPESQRRVDELREEMLAARAECTDAGGLKREVTELQRSLLDARRSTMGFRDESRELQGELAAARAGPADEALRREVAELRAAAAEAKSGSEASSLRSEVSMLKEQLATVQGRSSCAPSAARSEEAAGLSAHVKGTAASAAATTTTTMEQMMQVLELSKRNVELFNRLLEQRRGGAT